MAADAEAEAAVGCHSRRSTPAYAPLHARVPAPSEDFAALAMNSHANAVGNPNAMSRKAISERVYLSPRHRRP